MAATNVTEAFVREIYEAFQQENLDILATAFDDNVDFLSHAPVEHFPYLARRRGRAAVLQAFSQTYRAVRILTFLPLSILIERDDVAVTLFMHIRDRLTGNATSHLAAHLLHFCNGRIVRFTSIINPLDEVKELDKKAAELPT